MVVVRFDDAPRMGDLLLPDDIKGLALVQDWVITPKNVDAQLADLMQRLFEMEPELRIGAADGLKGVDQWWSRWSMATRPPLPVELPLAGRAEEVAALGLWLEGPPGELTLRCRTAVEGIAFVAGVLDTESTAVRAVVVESEQGAAYCHGLPVPLLVVVATTGADVQSLVAQGMHVLVLQNIHESDTGDDVVTLPRLRADLAYEEFLRSGLPSQQARRCAGLARRSLSVLRTTLAPGEPAPPWATENMNGLVLAGSWTTRDGYSDLDTVAALLLKETREVEEFALRAATSGEPLLHRSGTRWQLTDPEMGWLALRAGLTTSILRRWHTMAVSVLSEVDPLLHAPLSQWVQAKRLGTAQGRSDDFRKGVAVAAALMGGDRSDLVLASGHRPRDHAAELVRELLARCNADRTGSTWHAVASQTLPLLAEAAPEEFLAGLAKSLSGANPVMAQVLGRDGGARAGLFGPRTYLLWALETLCWTPDYLPQAVRVLARLAQITEFDERIGGSPLDTLRRVFQPGWAYTSATLEFRFQVLDGLRTKHPELAWKLLLELSAPGLVGRWHPRTHEPEFRADWLPNEPGPVPAEQDAAFGGLCERVLAILHTEPHRWVDVVPVLADMYLPIRGQAVKALTTAELDILEESVRLRLWEEVDRHVRLQLAYHGLTADSEVEVLRAVAARIEPRDLAERHAWLFDWRPRLARVDIHDLEGYDTELEALRSAAVNEAVSVGLSALCDLAGRSVRPDVVGELTARISEDRYLDEVVLLLDHGGQLEDFARRWVEIRAAIGGDPWLRSTSTRMTTWSAPGQAVFLLALSRSHDVRELLEIADREAIDIFWREVAAWPPPRSDTAWFVEELIAHGRAWSAISSLVYALESSAESRWNPSSDLVAKVLWAAVSDDVAERPGQLGLHDAADLLDHLTSVVGEEPDVVLLELAYRPLLLRDRETKALYSRAERFPEAFVELVRVSEFRGEQTVFQVAAYSALRDWRWRPDGHLELDRVADWFREVEGLLEDEDDRLRRTALTIVGHYLSGAPAGAGGVWPAEVVRDLLDEQQDDDALAAGFVSGVFANHGTTFRAEYDGGILERQRASELERDAKLIAPAWPGAAAVLVRCAKRFDRVGGEGDNDAEDTQDEF
ncbi:hypothetical protein SAMN04488000_126111 [Lentzea albida]|uniref:Uncharacterized protein n=1 Tax=Lentzea albida TaxID=65499 RepID=A0A1H9X1N0_9PSEU|nr:hypothetical protein SAMN04488000_126111 [Lentzea albida]